MNNAELKLEVISPTSIKCGNVEWFALDTKLVGKVKALIEENKRLSKNQRYYKNGVFSLENDKETMSDMIDDYKSRIDKSKKYIEDNIAVYGFGNKALPHWEFDDNNIQDLLKILKGEENE